MAITHLLYGANGALVCYEIHPYYGSMPDMKLCPWCGSEMYIRSGSWKTQPSYAAAEALSKTLMPLFKSVDYQCALCGWFGHRELACEGEATTWVGDWLLGGVLHLADASVDAPVLQALDGHLQRQWERLRYVDCCTLAEQIAEFMSLQRGPSNVWHVGGHETEGGSRRDVYVLPGQTGGPRLLQVTRDIGSQRIAIKPITILHGIFFEKSRPALMLITPGHEGDEWAGDFSSIGRTIPYRVEINEKEADKVVDSFGRGAIQDVEQILSRALKDRRLFKTPQPAPHILFPNDQSIRPDLCI